MERRTVKVSSGEIHHEVTFGVTSLSQDRTNEAEVLGLVRGHWTIEALHHIRDDTYDEDRSRVRTGNGPRSMAMLRNLATALIKVYFPNGTVPDGQRFLAWNKDRLLELIGAPVPACRHRRGE